MRLCVPVWLRSVNVYTLNGGVRYAYAAFVTYRVKHLHSSCKILGCLEWLEVTACWVSSASLVTAVFWSAPCQIIYLLRGGGKRIKKELAKIMQHLTALFIFLLATHYEFTTNSSLLQESISVTSQALVPWPLCGLQEQLMLLSQLNYSRYVGMEGLSKPLIQTCYF